MIPKFIFEGLDWTMHGVMRESYELLRNGQKILNVRRESTGSGERTMFRITDPSQELLTLAAGMTLTYVFTLREGGNYVL